MSLNENKMDMIFGGRVKTLNAENGRVQEEAFIRNILWIKGLGGDESDEGKILNFSSRRHLD